ncbi:hypothetical protein PhCBS80983_g04779 [Powellomyces hirtus]|uniref:PRELI/MSF1 domain-containing protein n=1 Tax=Powellomyces hirtus TaxID=109895 RepID=A0A507DY92_9FUNG|nr:PRELI-like family-domain-containing protein [Powellomyces hirtus]TPX56115.1 hypothetical protein PhCBS80983_g04779 [Powellomyces hirtus]
MHLFETSHLFPHPWSLLTSANFQKYPNIHSPHVLTVDILSRSLHPTTGHLHTERLISVTNTSSGPAWVRALLPISDICFFHETSILDVRNQHFEATSTNLSMRTFLTLEETVKMRPGEGGTVFTQTAVVNARGVLSCAARFVEEGAVRSFTNNSAKGRAGLQTVVDALLEQMTDRRLA